MWKVRIALASALIAVFPSIAFAQTEVRCGWFGQWTPLQYDLTDADGTWLLSTRGGGGYRTPGFLDLDFDAIQSGQEWRDVNGGGGLGYGCACLTGLFDLSQMKVMRVMTLAPTPLYRCDSDPALPWH